MNPTSSTRSFALALSGALLFVGCGEEGKTAANSSAQKSGTIATDFATTDIDGKSVRLGDYLGKKAVLLDFWTTFCEPCLHEIPHLRRIHEANKAKGFSVIAISMDGPETVGQVPDFVKRNGMVFPVWLDEDSHVASIYNSKKSAPLSVLIDKNGKVVRVHEGYNPGDEDMLAEEVSKVLQ